MAKILLIDDDRLLAETTEKMLQRGGHTVVRAKNGAVGLEAFAAEHPDLVITDIVMPEQDGIETIQKLLTMRPGLPILAVSGGGRTGNAVFLVAAKQVGAREVLAKPFRLEALLSAVDRCLQPAT
ncbi:MAG: response regulator [Rhodospirillaceae bacterium]